MQAFKLFFKILAKNKMDILIYLFVFIGVTFLYTNLSSSQTQNVFESKKIRLAVENLDSGEAAQALEEYLQHTTQHVMMPQGKDAQAEALYFEHVQYMLTIPEGFTQSLMSGASDLGLVRRVGIGSLAQVQVELLINRFINLAMVYRDTLPNLSAAELAARVQENLKLEAQTQLLAKPVSSASSLMFYFRYFSYAVMSMLIMSISSVMLSINRFEIRKRNAASPLSPAKHALQLTTGGLLLALMLWGLLTALGFIFLGKESNRQTLLLLAANSLVHTMVCLSLSVMLSFMITNHNVKSAVTNVVTLSLSFLSGVFVSQELLGQTVQRISSFLPTFWYIRAVDSLNPGLAPNAAALSASREGMLIQLGFIAAFLALTLLTAKRKGLNLA